MSSFLADASLVAEVPPGPSSMVKAMGDCFLASAFTSSPPPPSWEGVVALVEEVECELDLEKGGEVDELVVVGVEPGCSGPCGLASAGASLLSFLSVSRAASFLTRYLTGARVSFANLQKGVLVDTGAGGPTTSSWQRSLRILKDLDATLPRDASWRILKTSTLRASCAHSHTSPRWQTLCPGLVRVTQITSLENSHHIL